MSLTCTTAWVNIAKPRCLFHQSSSAGGCFVSGFLPHLRSRFMATVRQAAIKAIATAKYKLDRIDFKTTHVADLFGVNVFNEAQQRTRLPKPIFKSLQKTVKHG